MESIALLNRPVCTTFIHTEYLYKCLERYILHVNFDPIKSTNIGSAGAIDKECVEVIYLYIYIYIYKGQGVKFGVLYYQTFIIHNRYSLIITMIHENHSCLIYMIILNHSLKVNKDNLKKP